MAGRAVFHPITVVATNMQVARSRHDR
jgi:hypothetical protein